MNRKIHLQVTLVPSAQDLADPWSRVDKDTGDYTLNRPLLVHCLRLLRQWVRPQADCFASPGNHQFPTFISRYPHWQAVDVDALRCSLQGWQTCYAKPPLESNFYMVGEALEEPPLDRSHGDPHVGLYAMVAPVSKTAKVWDTSPGGETISGDVRKLFWRAHASASLAPSFHSFVRTIMESKKISTEEIDCI